jgi:tetratricopeptide (TPR) repeat protein
MPISIIQAQDFKEKFNESFNSGDSTTQLNILIEWEKTDNNDPELYVGYFNYYVNQARDEMIRIDNNPQGDQVLQISDTATGKPVGYMYSEIYYHPEIVNIGFDYIEKGIQKFPNRLDMRFGKIYMYGETKDYENFTLEIIKAVTQSEINNNEWTWSNSEIVKDPQYFFLGNIQDYQLQLYNTGDDLLLDNMRRIAEAILTYYPNHVESMSNISVGYLINEDYDKAIDILQKAEKLDSKDFIILSNIAHAYKSKGDKKNAIKYYKLTKKYGDDEAKGFAKTMIKELKEN